MNVAKIGVIDVGGGLRGIYAAGVFDWCLENGEIGRASCRERV